MLKLTYLKWVLGINRGDGNFQFITVLIFILAALNIYYKFDWTENGPVSALNLWNPSWLLFGPLLFCAYRALLGRPIRWGWNQFWHLLPFFLASCCYIIAAVATDMKNPWQNEFFSWYQNSYFVIVLSLMPYSIYVASRVLLVDTNQGTNADALILSMATIFVLISVLLTMMVIAWGIVHMDMGIDYRYFSYGLLLFGNALIIFYWISVSRAEKRATATADELNKTYRNSALPEPLASAYKQQVMAYFEAQHVYLIPNLSLELLSRELQIPKHHLSQLFNVHLEKSFHHFVAEYRISHAIALLEKNNGKLTIESLAHTCGFNSKTSLNRYFKDKTGLTPSAYQLQLDNRMIA